MTEQSSRTPWRIAIVTRAVHCGGAEAVTLALADDLVRRGHEVTIVTTADPGEWFGRIEETGARTRHIEGKHTRHPVAHAFHCARVVRDGHFNVVLLSNSERFVHAALPMLPPRVAVVPWIRSDDEDAYRKAGIHRRAWNVAVAVSPKVAETARSRLGRPVEYIPNGILPPDGMVAERLPRGPTHRLLFAGRLDNRSKGLWLLPEILRRVRASGIEATLSVVGDGPDRNELERRVVDAGQGQWVRFAGALPRSDVFAEYMQADILVAPSHFEGLPNAPIEAQWCGCVPVASRLPGVMDAAIRDSETGILVEPGNAGAFADAIAQLLREPARWLSLSREGRRWSRETFKASTMGSRFEELFAAISAGRFPPVRRRCLVPVALSAFTWREYIPRSLHRLGIGRRLRTAIGIAGASAGLRGSP